LNNNVLQVRCKGKGPEFAEDDSEAVVRVKVAFGSKGGRLRPPVCPTLWPDRIALN
jgi:hypothetical protein